MDDGPRDKNAYEKEDEAAKGLLPGDKQSVALSRAGMIPVTKIPAIIR
jgi:hypothetical protein